MRIVFMGTPEFAVPSLLALAAAEVDVVSVYARPDAVSGRGGVLRSPAVKIAALELGVPVRQPATLRDPDQLDALAMLAPDLIVVAAYGLILPAEALMTAHHGAVNVHASLLPRWRGAAPVQRAILAGDQATGVSIMRMDEGLDTGPYCVQVSTIIASKTASQLTTELARLGADTLVAALPAIDGGSARWQPQDASLATYAEKVAKSDVAISPSLQRSEAERRVRASMPASPSKISVSGRSVTLLNAAFSDATIEPGAVACTKTGLLLGVADGAIEIRRVKPDAKGEMDACAWARGIRDLGNACWEQAS